MKKVSEKQKKEKKTRSEFSKRYTPSFVGFSVMLAFSMYLVYTLNLFSLSYEPPVKKVEVEPMLIEVLSPYVEKQEPKKEEKKKDEGKYKVNDEVEAKVATGDAKVDEDAGAKPVKDNSISISEVKPEVTKDISAVASSGQLQLFSSKLTNYTFAAIDSAQGWNIIGNNLYYITSDHNVLTGNQMINSVRYYFNERGAVASLVGIDVSRHQGNIDWRKVRQAGIDFAIIRVGFRGYGEKGSLSIDDNFHKNIRGALAAGLRVGLYFYSQAINIQEAIDEASVAVQQARGYNITFPIYCDTEFAQTDRSGRADRLDYDKRTDCVEAFCETVRQAGYMPGVYASKSFFYGQLDFARLSSYQIWLAHYTKDMTNFQFGYQVWQYTDSARVSGITQNVVDLNIAYYDYTFRTDMSSNGQNVVLFHDYNDILPYENAERMIGEYSTVKTDEHYANTLSLINSLGIDSVKDTYKRSLEIVHLAVLTENLFNNATRKQNEEPSTEETET